MLASNELILMANNRCQYNSRYYISIMYDDDWKISHNRSISSGRDMFATVDSIAVLHHRYTLPSAQFRCFRVLMEYILHRALRTDVDWGDTTDAIALVTPILPSSSSSGTGSGNREEIRLAIEKEILNVTGQYIDKMKDTITVRQVMLCDDVTAIRTR